MAGETLAGLGAQQTGKPLSIDVFGPTKPTPVRAPQETAPPRGDDLIKDTAQQFQLNDLEGKEVELFQNSQNLLMQIADADPNLFETQIKPELMKRQGDEQRQYVIDKADEFKIGQLRQKYPQMFSNPNAGVQAFINSQMFGQLTRMQAAAKTAVGSPTQSGEPSSYDQHLAETAEWARLLAKAHPGANIVGEIGGFMLGPQRAVFERLATLGGKGSALLLEKLTQNPQIMERMAAKMVADGVGAAAGGAGLGAIKGYWGKDDDSFSFDRAGQQALKEGALAGAAGAVAPPLLKYAPLETLGALGGATAGTAYGAPGVGAAVGAGAGLAARAAIKSNRFAPSVLAGLAGGDLKAMRMYNKMGENLTSRAGTKGAIESQFLDFVFSDAVKQLPERQQADKLLPLLPSVDARPLLSFLEQKIKNPTKEQAAVMAELADRANWVRGQIKLYKGRPESVSAEGMRSITDELQGVVSGYYKKADVPDWADALKDAARMGRMSIVEQAKAYGGANGQRYIELMEKAAEKRQALKIVTDTFGKDTRYWPKKIEDYTNRMFGKNGKAQAAAMQDIDETFGTDFFGSFERSFYADKIGEMGPSPLNEWRTGAHSKGALIGGTIGGSVGAAVGGAAGSLVAEPWMGAKIGGMAGTTLGTAVGAAASSPRIASLAIGTSDKISGVIDAIKQYPDILNRAQRSGTPEVRRMAKFLSDILEKDGPMSMGSAMRVMADTPLFIGLVNQMHRSLAQEEKMALKTGLEKLRQSEIARQNSARENDVAPASQQGKFY